MRWNCVASLCVLAALGANSPRASAEVKIDSNTFGGLRARALGPAVMSGRIAALDGVSGDPATLYVGTASGGLWKSDDGGVTFDAIFDDYTQSIGAIRVDPNDPEVVWVGTGETWTRNSVSVGTGLYKSTDGGDSWALMGLGDSERIARIRVNPQDSDTVFVCATGHLWGPNEERGVFKTTDGGESWEKILYVDQDTGCADLEIDPQNPEILYAAMWQFRRSPDYFDSGGPGSGLHRSMDGGATWTELTEGLPSGEKGRIGIAVAPSRPSRVYAVVEADKSALYRSDDLGGHWEKVNESFNTGARPFYFATVIVDPENYERVFKPGLFLTVSQDGGESFSTPFTGGGGNVHGDHHALWIDPARPSDVVLGTDGGVYISHDRAATWRMVASLPVSQFYRVSADMDYPYNVMGGLQDNGSWLGPSQSLGGIQNSDWTNVGFGDGFWVERDTAQPDYLWVNWQGGGVLRVHLPTREARDVKPQPAAGESDYRWNWNAPIHLSPSEPGTVYVGAQFLFRTRDHGRSWEKISPDLTTNDPARQRQATSGGLSLDNSTAENNTTIYWIDESPLDGKVIWVGTDDGNVQVTRDSGGTWTDTTGNIPDLPAGLWISSVTASPHDAATAFVTVDGHRSDDMTPYVYVTEDFGASWRSLVTEDIEGYAYVVRQDPVNASVLFVGTEFGLYISLDLGQSWARFTGDLPRVSVQDLEIHPREHDLILGTHGRGIYILDDITPLRELTTETLESDVALLASRPGVMTINGIRQNFGGDEQFVGRNPPQAASIVYYLKKRHLFGDLKVEVYDAQDKLITTLPATKRRGLNRIGWPMRLQPPKLPPASTLAQAFIGPRVPEGTYRVKLIKGKSTLEGEVSLVADPRSPHSAEDRALQQITALELYDLLGDLTYQVDALLEARDAAREHAEGLPERDRTRKRLEDFADALEDFRGTLLATGDNGWISGEEKLREKLAELYNNVATYDGRPTRTQIDRTAYFEAQIADTAERFEELTSDLGTLNRALAKKGLDAIALLTREAWDERQEDG